MYQNNDITNATFFVSYYASNCNICKENDDINDILLNIKENSNYVIVIGENLKYKGVYKIADLLAGKKCLIYYHQIQDDRSVSELIKLKRLSRQSIIPVVDSNDLVMGIITSNTLKELIRIDFTEDYYRQAGFTSQERKSYDDGKRMGRRLPTLFMAFLTLFAIGIAMTAFKEEIKEYPLFAIYQVMILMVSSGYAIMVNAKTIHYLRFKKIGIITNANFVRGELKKGFVIALVLGIITFVVIYFYCVFCKKTIFSDEFYASDAMLFSGIIALGLFFSIIEASTIGLGGPFIIDHLHLDISTSSQLFIRTLTSSICVFIFYIWIIIGLSLI